MPGFTPFFENQPIFDSWLNAARPGWPELPANLPPDDGAADALRAQLQAAGWTVETTKAGTTLRR